MLLNPGPAAAVPFRVTGRDVVVLGIILAAGLAHRNSPFGGDQSLFLIGAEKLANHGVMYRDFWDLKQPLIFYVYALAGELFGFTRAGIHLFEAIYQTIFAALLIVVCARRFTQRWIASCVPLLTTATYYGFASNYALTSVEALAGFPLFLSAVFAEDAFDTARNANPFAFIAGVAGAFCIAFKLAFLPLLIALWLVPICMHAPVAGRRRTVAIVMYLGLGLALPIAALCGYFARFGVLDVALRTALVDPLQIVRRLQPADRSPFWPEARAFGRLMWPLLLLALAGLFPQRRRSGVFTLQMVAWLLAGCAIIVVQVWSYDYRFYLVVVPIGVLAAGGCDVWWSAARGRGRLPKLAFAAGLSIVLGTSSLSVIRVQRNWRDWLSDDARAARASEMFLNRDSAVRGAIYVFGDPRVYYFSGRDQAVPINGWSPQLFLPAQWLALRDELAAAAPPYIMIASDYLPRVRRSPEMLAFLASAYRETAISRDGTWYQRR